jgi:hypothetical protein
MTLSNRSIPISRIILGIGFLIFIVWIAMSLSIVGSSRISIVWPLTFRVLVVSRLFVF